MRAPIVCAVIAEGALQEIRRSYVHESAPNYVGLGRPDLDGVRLREQHAAWTDRLVARL